MAIPNIVIYTEIAVYITFNNEPATPQKVSCHNARSNAEKKKVTSAWLADWVYNVDTHNTNTVQPSATGFHNFGSVYF